jgi:signal transduction histidine kinase
MTTATASGEAQFGAASGSIVFAGDGEMRALCRAYDWSASSLGPVESWPVSLRTTVKLLLASRQPMLLFWGPDLIQFYNDAFRPSLGAGGRHPRGLGMRAREFWSEVWSIVGAEIEGVIATGVATWHEDALVPIERNGHMEDVYWTYSYGPAFDDGGAVAGVLVVCQETTGRVLSARENERLFDALAMANTQLEAQARDLERTNRALHETMQELETQAEELKAATDELVDRHEIMERARAEAEAANRSKADFLAVMSHELRTPLNAIGGYTELLLLGVRGSVTDAQRADLIRIQQSQTHLLGLINQVLNYTRIENGSVSYEVVDVSVSEALASAEGFIVPQIRSKSLTYASAECSPTLGVRADREKLQQILLNLLTNAIKFTNAGGRITVSCEARDGTVVIAVSDTGVGIASDKLGAIFEPFVQVDAKLTRRQEGVGLGLAISRDLARGMGGDLTAESQPGVGSTFRLVLAAASLGT